MAFQGAAKKAQPVVLEPVMQVEVRADNRHIKVVLGDLLRPRGDIHTRPETARGRQIPATSWSK
jgi:elongation factor G